jgi:predicted RNA-binding protein (virulence factor B family)
MVWAAGMSIDHLLGRLATLTVERIGAPGAFLVERDAERVLAALRKPGAPRVGDRSSPEQIRATFGLSKKAYKRALGHLLKGRKIDIDGEGFPRVL